jgi:hypothetical protein
MYIYVHKYLSMPGRRELGPEIIVSMRDMIIYFNTTPVPPS